MVKGQAMGTSRQKEGYTCVAKQMHKFFSVAFEWEQLKTQKGAL